MKVAAIAHPNSKKPRIEKDLLGIPHIYVSEPALKGKANKAITEALAGYLRVKKNSIRLISGQRSKKKIFEVI